MQPRLPLAAGIVAVCAFVSFAGPWPLDRAVSATAPLMRQARLVDAAQPAADATATANPTATATTADTAPAGASSTPTATADADPTSPTEPSATATESGTGTDGTTAPSPSEPAAGPTDDAEDPATDTDPRPNIVLITSDDQTEYDMRWMPKTRRLLGRAGVTFTDSVSPHPLCCPARAEILTGQFAQNNGVRTNKGIYGGYDALRRKRQTIGAWLQDAGYRTMFTGKFLNQYDGGDVRGWDEWHTFVGSGVYRYYDYEVSHNGEVRAYHDLHQADFLARQSVRSIREFTRGDRPFFIWQSHVAPHGACVPDRETSCWTLPVPATRHQDTLGGISPPSFTDPAFDELDIGDKPAYLQELPLATPRKLRKTRALFQARIESLQSVDEAVARTARALRTVGELDNTLILFTSDNGYLLGEHRYTGKVMPYERSLQVPLLMRGPGVPEGTRRHQQVATIDLAPTFLDAAGAEATLPVDGRSLLPLARAESAPGYDTLLIQAGPQTAVDNDFGGWFYRGVRTGRYTYVEYPRFGTELYDRLRDPHQLRNVAGDAAYGQVEAELARRTRVLEACSGASCRTDFGPVPHPEADAPRALSRRRG
jgi:N-acetylglucosamine-6-sulfatase